ncbi:hypothetical protein H2Y58_18720 [Pectobacterium aroidearum]|uniref:hypothetical protein n=1 Tax=Pectobacterium aroidearum TaxID=1201031 RepID=UPI0015F0B1E9|nr:hypothetical protein [Pectobacterium aroidearum]MBA5201336.1 hypothetical protein [Pectobacterium aroidearum]
MSQHPTKINLRHFSSADKQKPKHSNHSFLCIGGFDHMPALSVGSDNQYCHFFGASGHWLKSNVVLVATRKR